MNGHVRLQCTAFMIVCLNEFYLVFLDDLHFEVQILSGLLSEIVK